MKTAARALILLLMLTFLLTPMLVPVGAESGDEPGKYGDGTCTFYWPKDLPLPNGKVIFKWDKNDSGSGPHKRIDNWGYRLPNGQAVTKYRLEIDFYPEYDNLTKFEDYQKKVLKVFKNKEKTYESLYAGIAAGAVEPGTTPTDHFWNTTTSLIASTKQTFEFTTPEFGDDWLFDSELASIYYGQSKFVWEEDNRLIYYDDEHFDTMCHPHLNYNRDFAKTFYECTSYSKLGRASYIALEFYLFADEPKVDFEDLQKYTPFPLTKYYINTNGDPVEMEVNGQGEFVKGLSSSTGERRNYSVGDVIVIGGVTFVLTLIGGVPMWLKLMDGIPNPPSTEQMPTEKPQKEKKDFSKYGLRQTSEGNWIKQLRTREDELYHSITYDENGRPISEYILKPGDGGKIRKEIFTDDNGEIVKIRECGYDANNERTYTSEIEYNDKHEVTHKQTYDKNGELIEEQKKIRRENVVGDKLGDVDIVSEEYMEVTRYDGKGNKLESSWEDYSYEKAGKYGSDWSYDLDNEAVRDQLKVGRGKQYYK